MLTADWMSIHIWTDGLSGLWMGTRSSFTNLEEDSGWWRKLFCYAGDIHPNGSGFDLHSGSFQQWGQLHFYDCFDVKMSIQEKTIIIN